MKITTADKLKVMRESERWTSRPETAKKLGIPTNALWRYETGKTVPDADVIAKILSHPQFEKYTLWFITGKIAPEAGQIAPALAHFGQDNAESASLERKAG